MTSFSFAATWVCTYFPIAFNDNEFKNWSVSLTSVSTLRERLPRRPQEQNKLQLSATIMDALHNRKLERKVLDQNPNPNPNPNRIRFPGADC